MTFHCVGLGEVLWDVLPTGRQLGGAPANFAYHAAALGAVATVVSRIGDDPAGRDLLARLAELGLRSNAIEIDPTAPTSTVTVAMGEGGHPDYTIHENVAWDFLAGDAAARAAVSKADAVCFGTLAQRSPRARAAIPSLLRLTRADALRIYDVNLRQHYFSPEIIADSLELASVLKVNETELPQLAAMFGLSADAREALAALVQRHRLRAAVFTRGSRGSLIYANGAWHDDPGRPVNVVDTVGAGDSFTAAFALGLLHGWPLPVVSERATTVAAFVCSQSGATPALPPKIAEPFLIP